MYDEYPDREFLYRELLKVRERHPEETMGGTEEQDLLQVLFVNEIYRRRILNRVEKLITVQQVCALAALTVIKHGFEGTEQLRKLKNSADRQ